MHRCIGGTGAGVISRKAALDEGGRGAPAEQLVQMQAQGSRCIEALLCAATDGVNATRSACSSADEAGYRGGGGGLGKSGLELVAGQREVGGFADLLWWVDLGSLSRGDRTAQTVAQARGLRSAV